MHPERLTLETQGAGRPLLYLHEWGFGPQMWRHQADYLRTGFRNCVVDYNLAACSAALDHEAILGHLCAQLLPHVERDENRPFAILASGLGAFLAYELIEWGLRPERLVLFGGIVRFTNDGDYLSGIPAEEVSALRRDLHDDPQSMLRAFYQRAFSGEEESVPEELAQCMPVHAHSFLRTAFDALISHDYRELVPNLTCRTLIVQGDSDRVTPVWQGQLLRRLIPDATLHLCSGGGHLPFVSRYASLNRQVARFLDAE